MNRAKPILEYGLILVLCLFAFHLIIGFDKLNPTYTRWLLIQGSDYSYHYLAWEYFRDTPWSWPLGRIDGYCYPMPNSIIYTDSIPLFAFFFKLFRSWLPNDFQYIGLWHAACYVLNAFFAFKISEKSGFNNWIKWLGSFFFILPVVLIARFGHAALCGQFTILWALYIFLNRNQWSVSWYKTQLFVLFGISCLIHPYLVFMILGLCTMDLYQLKYESRINWSNFLLTLLGMLAEGFLIWYICGAFMFKGNLSEGLGEFSANLNTFINRWDVGRLGPKFEYYLPGQGEGIGYLGLGFILLLLFVLIYYFVQQKKKASPNNVPGTWNWYGIACTLFFLFALSPKWTLGHYLIIDWRYNDYISRTFRGTGRFIWPLFYFIIYWTLRKLNDLDFTNNWKIGLLIGALFLQAMDLAPILKRRPYIDHPPENLPWEQQMRTVISLGDKFIVYPPYTGTISNFMDYIYMVDMGQHAHKPITTGYGARFPWEVGHRFRDSLEKFSDYFTQNPHDVLCTNSDSINIHLQLIKTIGGRSYVFDHYRYYLPPPLCDRPELNNLDSNSYIISLHQQSVLLKDYLELNKANTVYGVFQQEGTFKLKPTTKEYLKSIGCKLDSISFGGSYAFTIEHGKISKQSFSNTTAVRDSSLNEYSKNRNFIMLYSGGNVAHENTSSIKINNLEFSMNRRGINMVVVDQEGKVLDVVNYDSYVSDEVVTHRW